METTKRKKLEILRGQLLNERASFLPHWRELSDYILPRRSRFVTSDVNKGDRRNQKIIDSTATLAARTLRSGMMAGVTSPARPWFRLTTPDPDLAEVGAVKDWLHAVSQRMSHTFLKSNLYNILPVLYGDLGVFGTAAVAVEDDPKNIVQCTSFPIGSYCLAKDSRGMVDTFFREYQMTVRQLVETFGEVDDKTGRAKWEYFSTQVRNLWDKGEYQSWIDVCHVIQPNSEYKVGSALARHKRFESCYYESGNQTGGGNYLRNDDTTRYLRESGYDLFPILAPRWEVTGEDVYGTSCPGMESLGDIKQLQLGEKRSAEAIDKMVRPPMTAPSHLKTQKVSILPGDITYVDTREGQQGFRPAYEVNPRTMELENKQEQVRRRIQRAFYEDLFLMLASTDRRQITAREIEERHEEKLLALGPVLEQLNQDLLDPLIDITFEIMQRPAHNQIPEAPEELQGVPLKVEYISVMAQSQKMVSLAGLDRLATFVGQLATVAPDSVMKIDTDQLIDEYGEGCGVSPRVIRPDEKVAKMRDDNAKAMAAQQQAEVLSAGAGAARDLSQANMEEDNALTRMIDNANSGALVEGA